MFEIRIGEITGVTILVAFTCGIVFDCTARHCIKSQMFVFSRSYAERRPLFGIRGLRLLILCKRNTVVRLRINATIIDGHINLCQHTRDFRQSRCD